jgi:hypothetical protein
MIIEASLSSVNTNSIKLRIRRSLCPKNLIARAECIFLVKHSKNIGSQTLKKKSKAELLQLRVLE